MIIRTTLCQIPIRNSISISNNDTFSISEPISLGLQFSSHSLVFMFPDPMVVDSFSEVFRFSLHPVEHTIKVLNCAFKRVPLWCICILKKNSELKNLILDFFYYYLLFIYFIFYFKSH